MYFTIETGIAGLGDQLGQLQDFYVLGRFCDFKYIFSPFQETIRMEKPEQLYDFLGFSHIHPNMTDPGFYKKKVVPIDLSVFLKIMYENEKMDLQEVKKNLHKIYSPDSQIIYLFKWSTNHRKEVNLVKNRMKNYPKHYGHVKKNIQRTISSNYWTQRERSSISLPFDSKKINIALHIRKGDSTARRILKRMLPEYIHLSIKSQQTHHFLSATKVDLPMETYCTFLDSFFEQYDANQCCICIFSDGFYQTFNIIREVLEELECKKEYQHQVKEMESKYKNQFDIFKKYPNTHTFIGNKSDNLFKAIHGCATADVVMHGPGTFATKSSLFFSKTTATPFVFDVRDESDFLNLRLSHAPEVCTTY